VIKLRFNSEVSRQKVFMAPNMITCAHIFSLFSNSNITLSINQVIDRLCFISKLNNTLINSSYESNELGPSNITLNVYINIF